jgi:N-dimethylarginine dimethylaminohydrolase
VTEATVIRPVDETAASEFSAVPARILVHDPSRTGAFDLLREVPRDELKERTLYSDVPDEDAFAEQHAALVQAIEAAGVEVVGLREVVGGTAAWRGVERNPNHVYTRDSAITLPWLPGHYLRCAMRAPIRRPEPGVLAQALARLGLRELLAAPADHVLEGGDVIPLAREGRRTLLVGFGPRTVRRSLDLLWERLAPWALDEIVGIELDASRMNLDGVLVPVADDTALAHPGSIVRSFVLDERGERPVDVLALLRAEGMEVIEVTREESMAMQACNCLCLGARRIVCYDLCERAVDTLRQRDLDVTAIPGSELIKGTGGPRCMSRPLYS